MNEMDQLSRFRNQVPAGLTPRTEEKFRAALSQQIAAEHDAASRPAPGLFTRFLAALRGGRPTSLRGRQPTSLRGRQPTWRFVTAIGAAAALAAGILLAVQPSGPQPLTLQLLADRAATEALTQPNLPAGQWVYQVLKWKTPGRSDSVEAGWLTADGRDTYGDVGLIGNPIFPYAKIDSLPRDPAKLNAFFISLDPVKTDNKSVVAFSHIESMLFGMVLPPWLEAEMFHALALIPGIAVKDNVKDIDGRAGVAFALPPTGQSEKLEIILDASDYHLLAQASWDNPRTPAPDNENAILTEYPVAVLGSTQPSTAPPNAAELLAEKIDYSQSYSNAPPTLTQVGPGQWLYREMSVGGTPSQIWATADDSAQAQYVHGTLQVCQRTAPCAAAEQWLMPAGPSYGLVYPPYQMLTRAQFEKLSKLPVKQREAERSKIFAQMQRHNRLLPTLPVSPQALLAKLNSYRTGCTAVAANCNAIDVFANMLTGYGNYPAPEAFWYLTLGAVPGVSLHQVTDAAGHLDQAFTFPAGDGVTQILLNASTLQYAGFVRDGQQTLVLRQNLVSGPGVRP